jgi:hypothetical protein
MIGWHEQQTERDEKLKEWRDGPRGHKQKKKKNRWVISGLLKISNSEINFLK